MGWTTNESAFDSKQEERFFPWSFLARLTVRPIHPSVHLVIYLVDEVAWIMMQTAHLCLVPDVMKDWRYTSTGRQSLTVGCSANKPPMFRFYQRVYCVKIICNFYLTCAAHTNYRQAKDTESV